MRARSQGQNTTQQGREEFSFSAGRVIVDEMGLRTTDIKLLWGLRLEAVPTSEYSSWAMRREVNFYKEQKKGTKGDSHTLSTGEENPTNRGLNFWKESEQTSKLEKEMATHSSILAWKIPWTEEPGGL